MGMGIYMTCKPPVPGVEPTSFDGKALAKNLHQLDQLAAAQGRTPISKMMSFDPNGLADYLDAEMVDDIVLPEPKWFAPAQGLDTVRFLLQACASDHDWISQAALLADLNACEQALMAAQNVNAEFYFTMDTP